jgi:hypothetical protein
MVGAVSVAESGLVFVELGGAGAGAFDDEADAGAILGVDAL